ncbi:MAG: GTP-binding protein [Gammaproteobacteria bacterium]|jgi:hypothetical protein|nr:GTP-binding protein [Gammaproteobacteria bacterium]
MSLGRRIAVSRGGSGIDPGAPVTCRRRGLLAGLASLLLVVVPPAQALSGRVLSGATLDPVPQAIVTAGGRAVTTDADGRFTLPDIEDSCVPVTLGARAPGFNRVERSFGRDDSVIVLDPFDARALYLSFYGIGSKTLRGNALDLMGRTPLNALVVDVKGDLGKIPYPSEVALANEIGARTTTTVKDMRGLVQDLKGKGVYLIARIVVFKDDVLAKARPELAVRTSDGGVFRDREKLQWVDASRKAVWDYNIAIAEEAARLGFDEIQFDYVRFPDRRGVVFGVPNTEANRVAAISGFLAAARERLVPYNVFLSADLFGYVAWNQNDTDIGQTLASVAPSVDYLSLMLYPSGFQFGIPGYRNPVQAPYETVHLTLKRAGQRTGLPPTRFRPWLQAFKDYAFDRRHFTDEEIRAQIRASEKFGSTGWMLWNPRNAYTDAGLLPE